MPTGHIDQLDSTSSTADADGNRTQGGSTTNRYGCCLGRKTSFPLENEGEVKAMCVGYWRGRAVVAKD